MSTSRATTEAKRWLVQPEFLIERDEGRCIACGACARQCANEGHVLEEDGTPTAVSEVCVGCQRCMTICPTGAITIRRAASQFRENANWPDYHLRNLYRQAEGGGVLLTGMGNPRPLPVYWDSIVLNASQVTNPSIDPLREPMELRTFLGSKPDVLDLTRGREGFGIGPQLELKIPVMFSAMSYGSISYNAAISLATAAGEMGTYANSGEGGLHRDFYPHADHMIVQVASGRFGVSPEYLNAAAAVEIKIGQGAKPGIGGHLPGEKVDEQISATRMIPMGTDALSPAPHHDIYSIEDLRQLIFAIKEATEYAKPVFVKISAVHNVSAIATGSVRAGADAVVIDGIRGGTGAAPTMIRDSVGIPIEMALAAVDQRLREEGIRRRASLIAAGSFRCSADVVKAIALGADAVYIGTAALVAMGCHLCQKCYTGKCNWGIATQDKLLTRRLNPAMGVRRLKNLLRSWSLEIKEMLGGMGINAIESLRGNREHLRGVGLNSEELRVLGIRPAGE